MLPALWRAPALHVCTVCMGCQCLCGNAYEVRDVFVKPGSQGKMLDERDERFCGWGRAHPTDIERRDSQTIVLQVRIRLSYMVDGCSDFRDDIRKSERAGSEQVKWTTHKLMIQRSEPEPVILIGEMCSAIIKDLDHGEGLYLEISDMKRSQRPEDPRIGSCIEANIVATLCRDILFDSGNFPSW